MRRACALACLATAMAPAGALAGGLAIVGGSPRAIGRAGASAVGDDGGGALLVNPAALARRDSTRVQFGIAFSDDAITWRADNPDAPLARDQAGSSLLPLAAVIGSIGPWIVAGGVMTAGVTERALRDPSDVPMPDDFGAAFEYRYNGIAGKVRRDTLTLGVARRIGEAVALGVSFGASRITVDETRRLWVGFAGVTTVGDPSRDIELSLHGTDTFVPSATAGILIAPTESPMELGASVSWTQRTVAAGDVAGSGTLGGPSVRLVSPSARLAFRHPVTVRAGARYLGDRYVFEVGGDLWVAPRSAQRSAWSVDGVRVVDPSTVAADLVGVPSRLSQRTHGAARAALDVELIGGFLWATAGYAYTVGGTSERRLSPSFGALGGHTIALGVEGTAGGYTYTLGWSRTMASTRHGGQLHELDNPFGAGDGTVPLGDYDGSADQVGVLLDIELDAP